MSEPGCNACSARRARGQLGPCYACAHDAGTGEPRRDELLTIADAELDELERLASAATPGPWRIERSDLDRPDDIRVHGIYSDRTNEGIVETDSGVYPPKEQDAQFIATSRTALPALIAALRAERAETERLRAERDEVVESIDAARGHGHGMRPSEAVADLSKKYCDLSVAYSRIDEQWFEASNERDAALAEVERLRALLGEARPAVSAATLMPSDTETWMARCLLVNRIDSALSGANRGGTDGGGA